MADVRPFRGWHYNLAKVGALSYVVAPPYDVIDPEQQTALYDRSPYNVVRLILNRTEPTDDESDNRYTRAARLLKEWMRDEILVQDREPGLYVCHQAFTVEGKSYLRRGYFARVRLEPFGEGKIYPHEETMPGPKADRLKLMQATRMNLSPIFGLFPDDDCTVQELLEGAVAGKLPVEATDDRGVVTRLWQVTDRDTLLDVARRMQPLPIFIADGHHRYETALRYLQDQRAAGLVENDDDPCNFVMMALVGMADPGLRILPTHRLISGIGDISTAGLREALAPYFECRSVGTGGDATVDAWRAVEAGRERPTMALATASEQEWFIAGLTDDQIMCKLAPEHSEAWRRLAVSVLHRLVIDRLLTPIAPAAPECRYVHLLAEVKTAIEAGQCDIAALVPPASMDDVQRISQNLEKMPPKSTYFYPKLLSGLLFNSLA